MCETSSGIETLVEDYLRQQLGFARQYEGLLHHHTTRSIDRCEAQLFGSPLAAAQATHAVSGIDVKIHELIEKIEAADREFAEALTMHLLGSMIGDLDDPLGVASVVAQMGLNIEDFAGVDVIVIGGSPG